MRIPAILSSEARTWDEPTRSPTALPIPPVAAIAGRDALAQSSRDEAVSRTRRYRPAAELLAQFLALTQVTEQGLGQECLSGSVVGPLELVMTPRHVLDQVFHPKQRVTPISHRGVLLHSRGPQAQARFPFANANRSREAAKIGRAHV